MSGRKLLITGGLGNVGSWLTTFFSDKFEVYILSKSIQNILDCKYKIIQADISDLDDLKLKLNIKFDYCVHAASYNEFFHENYSKKALEINTLGTRNLLEVLKKTGLVNFIYLSTFHIYGRIDGCVNEKTDSNPFNDYASTHLFAEYYVKQFFNTDKVPFVILRLTNSYGTPKYINSSKWYLLLNDLVKLAYEKKAITLKGNGKAKRDFIWMGDVCSVVEKSLDFKADKKNVFNLSSATSHSIFDLAKKVQLVYFKRYNKKIEIFVNENDKSGSFDLIVDNSKLQKLISLKMNDMFDQEINNTFDLLEKN